jgi:hypothetical protein
MSTFVFINGSGITDLLTSRAQVTKQDRRKRAALQIKKLSKQDEPIKTAFFREFVKYHAQESCRPMLDQERIFISHTSWEKTSLLDRLSASNTFSKSTDNCGICQDTLAADEPTHLLCGHALHLECAGSMFEHGMLEFKDPACPICRRSWVLVPSPWDRGRREEREFWSWLEGFTDGEFEYVPSGGDSFD